MSYFLELKDQDPEIIIMTLQKLLDLFIENINSKERREILAKTLDRVIDIFYKTIQAPDAKLKAARFKQYLLKGYSQPLKEAAEFKELINREYEFIKYERVINIDALNDINVIISIKPEYANKIKSGEKTVELRSVFSKLPHNGAGINCFIYESRPKKEITARFKVLKVTSDYPVALWDKVGHLSGLSLQDFFNYCKDPNKKYHALHIEDLEVFNPSLNPYVRFKTQFRPPQSYKFMQYGDYKLFLKWYELHVKKSKQITFE